MIIVKFSVSHKLRSAVVRDGKRWDPAIPSPNNENVIGSRSRSKLRLNQLPIP